MCADAYAPDINIQDEGSHDQMRGITAALWSIDYVYRCGRCYTCAG